MRVLRRFHFYAAHRNADIGGKCARLHGHCYRVEATIDFPYTSGGVSLPFETIDKLVAPIFAEFDHRTIVDVYDSALMSQIPVNQRIEVAFPTSAENLAAYFLRRITTVLEDLGTPTELRLSETDSGTIICTPADLQHYPTR
jgi:6-pyruvoyl-tetrahydropterin synthase